MAADDWTPNEQPAGGDDRVVELASTGELDGQGLAVYRPRWDGDPDAASAPALVHRAVRRPLLPYQYALCAALGISTDEFHEFLAVQRDWRQSEEERLAIVRADPGTLGVILFVVGVIFQVISALLAPKPEDPKGGRQSRNQRFTPRFGFNSTQELATYGDTVPLVYCNRGINPQGSVRLTTQLIWSAVESSGSAQYMQLLLLVGAANVQAISFNKCAFGQLPLGDIREANTWVYYNGKGGPVRFNNRVIGDNRDPARDGLGSSDVVHQIKDGDNWRPGFSQALTPTAKTTFGCYSPIPINVELIERRQSGKLDYANNGIQLSGDSWGTSNGSTWDVGTVIQITFKGANPKKDKVADEAAKQLRYQLVDQLDIGSTYQLGSALWKLTYQSDNRNLDDGPVFAGLQCIQKGRRPTTSYIKQRARAYSEAKLESIENALDVLTSPAYATREEIDKVLVEANANVVGSESILPWAERPTLYEADDREIYRKLQENDVEFSFGSISYSFKGARDVTWTDLTGRSRTFTFYPGGSLQYTRRLLDQKLNDKPKLRTDAVRKAYDADLEAVRQLRDEVAAGGFESRFRSEAKTETTAQNLLAAIKEQRRLRRQAEANNDIGAKQVADDEIDRLQEERSDYLDRRVGEKQEAYVLFLRTTTTAFTGIDGNRYLGGIRVLKDKINSLQGDFVTDQIGAYAIKAALNDLLEEKEEAINYAQYIVKNWEQLVRDADNNFYTKCLCKTDSASYQTLTACDYVKLNIRGRLFRRVQGRAKTYGKKDAPDGFKFSDNGIHGRMAFFAIRFREADGVWQRVPTIFTMRRAADADSFVTIKFESPLGLKKREFEFLPILDPTAEIAEQGYLDYSFLENAGKRTRVLVGRDSFSFIGYKVPIDLDGLPKQRERGPIFMNEWDFFSTRSDSELQTSADQGPEFELVNVTEQQKCADALLKYDGFSLLSIHTYSGAGLQDLRNVTAFVREGKTCWIVDETSGSTSRPGRSSSYAPDIFADTVLDKENGIGQTANPNGIDWERLALAKRFCKNNGLGCEFFMDGAIAEPTSWRQFWVDAAPFSLLEFARINGRETLIPALPVAPDGDAQRQVAISALFNQGNILEGSYKEEFLDYGDNTKDLIATVIYRDTRTDEVFPRNESVTLTRFDTNTSTAVRQTFDLSNWVTQRRQAVLYGRLLCNLRRYVRSAIEFKTVPTDTPIGPGDYIFVDIGTNSWDSVLTGSVGAGGALNAPLGVPIPNGTYTALTYRSGDEVSARVVSVVNGVAATLSDREGALFSLGVEQTNKRVFRVTEVSMEEGGETTVKATVHPCNPAGLSFVAKLTDSDFIELGVTCS